MTDIRQHLNLLGEASLRDIAASAVDKVKAATGDEKAAGTVQARKLKTYLDKQFKKWLGQTGNEPTEEALMTFLTSKIGFTVANVRKIFDKAGLVDPTGKTNESIINEELTPALLDKALTAAAQFAFQYDLVDTGEDEKGKVKKQNDRSDDYSGSSSRRRRGGSGGIDDEFNSIRDKVNGKQNNYMVDKQELLKNIQKSGLSKEHLNDLKDVLGNLNSFNEISKMDTLERKATMDQLAKIGFAFFKSQN